jgi:hypothetical protein
MTTETIPAESKPHDKKIVYRGGASETVYGLGFLGALVYYIGHATTLWIGLLGFFKAIFWPAVLVYEALHFFGG